MISAPAGPDVPEKIINLRRITNTGFMILIADSGSTKTEWLLVGKEGVERSFRTAGLNPYLLSEDEIRRLLTREVLVELPVESMTELFFYGAGCVGRPAEMLCAQLRRVIGADTVEVHSDLLGAARALCGDAPGIVAILGTGSNSGLYDGRTLTRSVPSLGYLLGDEGSGSDLGKHFLSDAMKGLLPESVANPFFDRYPLSQGELLESVYRRPFPNRFMARFAPFLHEHLDDDYVRQLVAGRFEAFFRRNILAYPYTQFPVHFVGSVAYYFAEVLREVARSLSVEVATILPSPGEALARYHAQRMTE